MFRFSLCSLCTLCFKPFALDFCLGLSPDLLLPNMLLRCDIATNINNR